MRPLGYIHANDENIALYQMYWQSTAHCCRRKLFSVDNTTYFDFFHLIC